MNATKQSSFHQEQEQYCNKHKVVLRCAENCLHTKSVVILQTIPSSSSTTTNKNDTGKRKKKQKLEIKVNTTFTLPPPPTTLLLPTAIVKKKRKLKEKQQQQQQHDPSTIRNEVQCYEIHVQPLLILDVNGILCHRVRSTNIHNLPKRTPIAYVAQTNIIPRLHLNEFLQLLDQHFTIAIWTSATKKTAKRLLPFLIPQEIQDRLLFVWNQKQCFQKKIKQLSKVWDMYPLWNESNTILIDDSPNKCPNQFRGNALHPPPINGLTKQSIGEILQQNNTNNGTTINSTKKGCTTTSTNHDYYCDETNGLKQLEFFQKLISDWKKCLMNNNKNDEATFLKSYLSQYGIGHMGHCNTNNDVQEEEEEAKQTTML